MTAAPPNPSHLTEQLELLGQQLVWRVGRDENTGEITVRVGFASATPRFAFLPKLRPVTDPEVQAALQSGEIRIHWIGD